MFDRKKMVLICFLFVLIVICTLIFEATIAKALAPGNLACNDLTNCTTDANCGGPGTPTGCYILCDNGADITCPAKKI